MSSAAAIGYDEASYRTGLARYFQRTPTFNVMELTPPGGTALTGAQKL